MVREASAPHSSCLAWWLVSMLVLHVVVDPDAAVVPVVRADSRFDRAIRSGRCVAQGCDVNEGAR
jgi:hypothetical protein